MRTLFVSTNRCREIMPPMPLGIASLAPYLDPRRHPFSVLDLMFEAKPAEALRRALQEFEPEAVAFSIRNLENQLMVKPEYYLPEIKGWVDEVRSHSRAQVIIGGAAVSVLPEAVFRYLEPDAGIAGEAEELIAPLLDGLEAGRIPRNLPGLMIKTRGMVRVKPNAQAPDLNRLILPNRRCLELETYRKNGSAPNLVSKRGCAFGCIFCDTPVSEGQNIRAKSPARLADEVKSLLDLGFEECFITDPIFNYPAGYAEGVAEEFIRHGFIVKWTATLHPRYLTPEQLDLLKKAGLGVVLLGSDHASADMLEAYNKQITPEELIAADSLLRQAEIPYFISLLFGGPGESKDSVARALDLAASLQPRLVTIRIGLRIYPGTPLHQIALHQGRLQPRADLLKPVFYLEKGAENWIVEFTQQRVAEHGNWRISGIPKT